MSGTGLGRDAGAEQESALSPRVNPSDEKMEEHQAEHHGQTQASGHMSSDSPLDAGGYRASGEFCLLKALGRLLGASETALGCSWVPLEGPGTAFGRLLEGSWEALGGFQEASWTKDRNS